MSEKMNVSIRARIQVTVEFMVGDSWGGDCDLDQVYKQAREAAIHALQRGRIINGMTTASAKPDTLATIVADPKITAILVEKP
jgi:hypothetical protein